jgi:hypothetical protein
MIDMIAETLLKGLLEFYINNQAAIFLAIFLWATFMIALTLKEVFDEEEDTDISHIGPSDSPRSEYIE